MVSDMKMPGMGGLDLLAKLRVNPVRAGLQALHRSSRLTVINLAWPAGRGRLLWSATADATIS
jgi:CheY-like chemotaxis protein